MVFATVFYYPISTRSNWIADLGKYVGLEIEGKVKPEVENYEEMFPLNKCPAIITPSGFKLTETIAIYSYIINNSSKKEFLGVTEEEKATNIKWISFFNQDFMANVFPLMFSQDEALKKASSEKLDFLLNYIDNELKNKTTKYLSSDEILVGDIFVSKTILSLPNYGYEISKYENVSAYLESVKTHPLMA